MLRTGKRQVFAINPVAAARYRDRHSVSRKKSDPGDALVLANILRTDIHAHRALPADSAPAQAVAVLARAQQDTTWSRVQGDVWNHKSLPTRAAKAVVGCSPSAFQGRYAYK